jgi:hypothetical protein
MKFKDNLFDKGKYPMVVLSSFNFSTSTSYLICYDFRDVIYGIIIWFWSLLSFNKLIHPLPITAILYKNGIQIMQSRSIRGLFLIIFFFVKACKYFCCTSNFKPLQTKTIACVNIMRCNQNWSKYSKLQPCILIGVPHIIIWILFESGIFFVRIVL